MTVIPAFRNFGQAPEPWTDETCDIIRTRWQASIPRELRRRRFNPTPSNLGRGTETLLERAAAHRAKLAKVILPLHREGQTVPQLSLAAKCSHATVRRVLFEQGHEPNVAKVGGVKKRDWVALMPETHKLRKQGMSWKAIGQKMGVSCDRLRECYSTWEARA